MLCQIRSEQWHSITQPKTECIQRVFMWSGVPCGANVYDIRAVSRPTDWLAELD